MLLRPLLCSMVLTGMLTLLLAPPVVHASEVLAHENSIVDSYAFLRAHPDLKHRKIGLQAYDDGDFGIAFKRFRQAARYADKMSQAMLAEMLWRGEGVPRDRAAAYAWMDLAAERAFPALLAKREHYWNALDDTQRTNALRIGKGLYTQYGDHIAKSRLEHKLRLARYERTGSNVGFVAPSTSRSTFRINP